MKKHHFPLSHKEAVKYGKQGGNPLLMAQRQGKRITVDGKPYHRKSKQRRTEMAKRKSPKRVAAGKKAARTSKRRYGKDMKKGQTRFLLR